MVRIRPHSHLSCESYSHVWRILFVSVANPSCMHLKTSPTNCRSFPPDSFNPSSKVAPKAVPALKSRLIRSPAASLETQTRPGNRASLHEARRFTNLIGDLRMPSPFVEAQKPPYTAAGVLHYLRTEVTRRRSVGFPNQSETPPGKQIL